MSVLYAVAGGSHSLCLTDCGSVWSWGACRHGQLGLGDITFATAAGWESGVPWPCLVETLNDIDEPVVTMAAGGHHTLFVTAGGRVRCKPLTTLHSVVSTWFHGTWSYA